MNITDTEILDWLEKNMNRILVCRGSFGVLRFKWSTRDDTGLYNYHPEKFLTLREAAAAAIAHDQGKEARSAAGGIL
jgi:hypothetical protein